MTAGVLEKVTSEGWRLEERFSEVFQASLINRNPLIKKDALGIGHVQGESVTHTWSAPQHTNYFLISKDREGYSKLADMTEQHRVSQEHIKELEQELKENLAEQEELESVVKAAEGERETHRRTLDTLQKLKEYFGEAQIKAALTVKTLDPKPLERL